MNQHPQSGVEEYYKNMKKPVVIKCRKLFADYPFAHRQPTHKGHCALIHGHNWSFELEFEGEALDENGFVIDFGKLKFLKEWFEDKFDHTLVLPKNDPSIEVFLAMERSKLCKLTLLQGASAESIALYVMRETSALVAKVTEGRVDVITVTVYEDGKNSATVNQ